MNGHSGNSMVLLDLSLGLSNSETLYSFHCITAPQALWIRPEELQTGVCSPESLINRPENVLAKAGVKDPDNSALCRLLALLWGVQSPGPATLQENAFDEATMHWAWAAWTMIKREGIWLHPNTFSNGRSQVHLWGSLTQREAEGSKWSNCAQA